MTSRAYKKLDGSKCESGVKYCEWSEESRGETCHNDKPGLVVDDGLIGEGDKLGGCVRIYESGVDL